MRPVAKPAAPTPVSFNKPLAKPAGKPGAKPPGGPVDNRPRAPSNTTTPVANSNPQRAISPGASNPQRAISPPNSARGPVPGAGRGASSPTTNPRAPLGMCFILL